MSATERCPKCGTTMKRGIIRSQSNGISNLFWGPHDWNHERHTDLKKFEKIATDWFWVDLQGWRCPKCRIITISYPEQDFFFQKKNRS